jgi:CheY-like chemotaxis protein
LVLRTKLIISSPFLAIWQNPYNLMLLMTFLQERISMKRVLIVDDNRLERSLIVHILRNAYKDQIQIDEANDGESAISFLSRTTMYDLVITDLVMPRIEGLELISKIRLLFPSNNNILAISGSNPYYLTLAKKLGAIGVFTKPLDKDRFLHAVNCILNKESIESERIA